MKTIFHQQLTSSAITELLKKLKIRFAKNKERHKNIEWDFVEGRIKNNAEKIYTLCQMELTGGEPDVISFDEKTDDLIFCDCTKESPSDRRSLCYDRQGLDSRKNFKPKNNALDMASAMGIELLTEEQYRALQNLGPFDCKTSSWIKTPESVRKLGGALFADFRFGRVFIYHNTAQSYYASRGFRGILQV